MAQIFSTYEFKDRGEVGQTPLNKTSFNAIWQSLDGRLDVLELNNGITIFIPGVLTVGSTKARIIWPFKVQKFQAVLAVTVAPTVTDVIVDINKSGTTIFTTQANRPKITAGQTGGNFLAGIFADVSPINPGDQLEIDVDQIGSGVAGLDLAVTMRGEKLP